MIFNSISHPEATTTNGICSCDASKSRILSCHRSKLCSLPPGDELKQIAIWVSNKRIPIVVAGVVWRLDARCSSSDQAFKCPVDVVRPQHQGHRGAPWCGDNPVNPFSRLNGAECNRVSAQLKVDVFGLAFRRGSKCFNESKQLSVEDQSCIDIRNIEIQKRCFEHGHAQQ